ncbi:hypothetical protein [Polyangium spumosum]|uniref:Uncharacterized protein n=1 Tax=Polyangium spumosum TaxID=889282 RepID=A0A6N7PQA3_9BACT|nr:hypothetical protein [Polyangium spumosum]MRG92540.1 hypothetical protein [Polyangium spumosum]
MSERTELSDQAMGSPLPPKTLALVGVEDMAGVSVRFGSGHLVEIDCVPGMFVTVHPGSRIVIHGPHKRP